jgi:hypothetical protein
MVKSKTYLYFLLLLLGLGLGYAWHRRSQHLNTAEPHSDRISPAKAADILPFYEVLIPLPQHLTSKEWLQYADSLYPGKMDFYLSRILNLSEPQAFHFFKSPYLDSLHSDVLSFWQGPSPEVLKVREQLGSLLHRYREWRPEESPPELVGMMGLFGYQVALAEEGIWIGLDLFMKPDYRYYPGVDGLHTYLRRRTYPHFLPPALGQALAEDLAASFSAVREGAAGKQNRLLDLMLEQGKILTVSESLLPELHDSLRLGYTQTQWEWIREHQEEVWRKWISLDLLYSEDPMVRQRYLGDGPCTNEFGPASPPALGKYFGYQIMRSWLKKLPQKSRKIPSLKTVLRAEWDADKVLRESGYRGRDEG